MTEDSIQIVFSSDPVPHWSLETPTANLALKFGPRGVELVSFAADGIELPLVSDHPLSFVSLSDGPLTNGNWVYSSWGRTQTETALQIEVVSNAPISSGTVRISEHLWLAHDLPVLRRWTSVRNDSEGTVEIAGYHLIDLALDHDLSTSNLELFSVDAFAGHRKDRWDPGDANFALREEALGPGDAKLLQVGAYQERCSWMAIQSAARGCVVGLEYDGATELRVFDAVRSSGASTWGNQASASRGVRLLAAPTEKLNVRLAPSEEWTSPGAFVGLFSGDWDDAAHVTHALIEKHLAPPLPDADFPYVMFNSWGYAFDTNPESLLRCLDLAAEIGVEVFVADYGWAREVGDWVSVADRMPVLPELRRLVHDRGMKLGAWMGFANAGPNTPVLTEHPEWRAYPNDWGSFKSRAICLAEPAVRDWVVAEMTRVVEEYGLSYLVHDFELITPCTHPDHHHPPDPGGYHSTMGYTDVLRRVRAAHTDLVIENCQGGGRLMTYAMVQTHDTSITSDGPVLRDALGRRQALYGASYPFSLRFCDNYMEERPTDMACHSSMIGGPWILMDQLTAWGEEDVASAKRNIALYKRIRPRFHDSKVFHLRRPDGVHWDALQVQKDSGEGVLYLFQPADACQAEFSVALRGLHAALSYRVTSGVHGNEVRVSGGELLAGWKRSMAPGTSDIFLIDPA